MCVNWSTDKEETCLLDLDLNVTVCPGVQEDSLLTDQLRYMIPQTVQSEAMQDKNNKREFHAGCRRRVIESGNED